MTEGTQKQGLKTPQPYLREKGLIVFIAFLGAFIPLSTDIYLPALPQMVESLHTNATLVNMTLTVFFLFYALAMLIWGPLSDKYGRKPILVAGLGIYTLASLSCIFAGRIEVLIVCRVFQAIGCGASSAVSTAVIRDTYDGKKRIKILAIVQTLGTTSPVISPVIGAFILQLLSWRGVFGVLAILGVICLVGACLFRETIVKKSALNVFQVVGRVGSVLRNKGFRQLLLMFSLVSIAFMGFISASAFIYEKGFGVSEKAYSLFFAANAIFLLLGPTVYLLLSRLFSYRKIISFAYGVMIVSGLCVATLGHLSPLWFCIALAPASLFANVIGPPRTNLLLEQITEDIGSASSLMGGSFMMFGIIGMTLLSVSGIDRIMVLGLLYAILGLASLVIWRVLSMQSHIRHFEQER